MKRLSQIICTLLAATMLLSLGVSAVAEPAQPPVKIWYVAESTAIPTGTIDILRQNLLEKYNIELTFDVIAKDNYQEKLNVMIASESFPDIIDSTGIARMGEAVDAGLILPLDDMIAQDALWSTVEKSKFGQFVYQNAIYGLPVVIDRPTVIHYREDWLANLGLSLPATIDELYEVLRAFTYDDPDGNGKKDTFGISFNSSFGQTQPIWFLFLPGVPAKDCGFYFDEEAGTVKNVFQLKDDMAAALTWLKKLYDDGILDPEFVLDNSSTEESKFVTGKTGMWLKGLLWIEPRQAMLSANNPDGSAIALPAIEGAYGTNYKQTTTGRGLYLTRALGEDRLEAAFTALSYIAGPDGIRDLYFGTEGVTYTIEDGQIIWTNPDDASLYNPGNPLSCAFAIEPLVPAEHLERNIEITQGYEVLTAIYPTQSETYNLNGADMKKLITEGITKIIIGEEPLAYLDTMVEELDELGMQEVCDELNNL